MIILKANNAKYQTSQSAGFDVTSTEDVVIPPHTTVLISTGLFINDWYAPSERLLPYLEVTSRSSIARQGIIVVNAPGIIDADYKDEIKILLHNLTSEAFTVTKGMRVAQILGKYTYRVGNVVVSHKERSGGCGSTGVV